MSTMSERQIFEAALEIAEPDRRQAYLDQACGGDAELRSRVEGLLASHGGDSQFLAIPAIEQLGESEFNTGENTVMFPSNKAAGDDESDDETPVQADLSFLLPSSKPGSIGMLGHYEILQVLGQGGFGIVFKAFDEKLHRIVAIKAMNPQMAATSPPRKRFLREARAAAAIRHENVIQVYSVEEQPLPYMAMEYIDGKTLQDKLDGAGPLDVPEILHIGRQMASGLAAAHALGLIHRDIKPANILLEQVVESKVKISDFGLARAADDASLTRTGVVSGTPMYMSPEQATGATIDHRSDLFSVGSVLYQMASGRPPFRAPNLVAVLKRVVDETPRPIREIIPEVPDWLEAIIAKLHAKSPEDRFASAKEVADLLGRCQAELQQTGSVKSVVVLPATASAASSAIPAPVVSAPHRPASRSGRRPAVISALVVTLLAGLGLAEATGLLHLRRTLSGVPSPVVRSTPQVEADGLSEPVPPGDAAPPGEPSDSPPAAAEPKPAVSDPDREFAQWALSNHGHITVENKAGWVDLKPGEPLPNDWFIVRIVDLRDGQMQTAEDVARLSRCQYLEDITVLISSSDGDAIEVLSRLPRVHRLVLIPTRVPRTSPLRGLARMSTLTYLGVSNDMIDDGFEFVQHVPSLRTLVIWTPRAQPDLSALADAGSLRTVVLKTPDAVDMDQLAAVQARHDRLRMLVEWEGKYRAAGDDPVQQAARHLVDLGVECFASGTNRRLSAADLDEGTIGWIEARTIPAGIQLAAADREMLMRLEMYHFTAAGQHEADALAASLAQNPGLVSVNVPGSDLTDAGLEKLQQLKVLRSLNLFGTKVTKEGVEQFRRAVPSCWINSDFGDFRQDYWVRGEAARP